MSRSSSLTISNRSSRNGEGKGWSKRRFYRLAIALLLLSVLGGGVAYAAPSASTILAATYLTLQGVNANPGGVSDGSIWYRSDLDALYGKLLSGTGSIYPVDQLAAGSVTSSDLANFIVTNSKIGVAAVNYTQLASGITQTPVSYTIWISGGTTYARDGGTGAVTSGADSGTMITNTVNGLASGGKVFIKAGTYTINAKILFTVSNIELFGEGTATILKAKNLLNDKIIEVNNGLSGWFIHHLAVDGTKLGQSALQDADAQRCDGIYFKNTNTNVEVAYCYIHDTRCFGIEGYKTSKSKFHHNYLYSNDANHICINNGAYNIISENFCDGNSDPGISIHDKGDIISSNILINCNLERSPFGTGNTHVGIAIEGSENNCVDVSVLNNIVCNATDGAQGVGIKSDPMAGYTNRNILIKGNKVLSCYDGISSWLTTGFDIIDNTVDACGHYGINIATTTTTKVQIAVNHLSNMVSRSIYISTDGAQIVGNTIRASGGYAIHNNGKDNLLISSNVIDTATGHGIYFDGGDYATITANRIKSCTQAGIDLESGATNNVLSANTITDSGTYGVTLQVGANNNRLLGNVFNNNVSGALSNGGTGTILESNQGTAYTAVYTLGTSLFHIFANEGDSQLGTAGRVFIVPLEVREPITITHIGVCITTAGGGGTTAQLGIYNSASNIPDGQAIVVDAGTIDATAVGPKELAVSLVLSPGKYFLCLETQDATVKFRRFMSEASTAGLAVAKEYGCYYDRGGGYGALTTPCPVTTAEVTARPLMWVRYTLA